MMMQQPARDRLGAPYPVAREEGGDRRLLPSAGAAADRERHIKPIVDAVYPIADAAAAHDHVAANKNFGKVVLQIRG